MSGVKARMFFESLKKIFDLVASWCCKGFKFLLVLSCKIINASDVRASRCCIKIW